MIHMKKRLSVGEKEKKLFLRFSLHSCQASLQPFIWHKSYMEALSFVFSPLLLLQLTAAIAFLGFGIVVSSVCLVIDGVCVALNMVRYLHLLVTSADGCAVNWRLRSDNKGPCWPAVWTAVFAGITLVTAQTIFTFSHSHATLPPFCKSGPWGGYFYSALVPKLISRTTPKTVLGISLQLYFPFLTMWFVPFRKICQTFH